MNHIYKTILDRNTGVIKAVAENASGHCKSQTKKGQIREVTPISTIKKNKGNIKILSFAVALIFNGLVMTFSHAETYTGDGNTLKTSNQVSTQFEQLINNTTAKGILGNSVNGNKILTIDYASGTTPDFVVLGYETVNDGNNAEKKETNNNQIIFERGNIAGNIYAGLSHYTKRTEDTDCSVDPQPCKNGIAINFSDTIGLKELTSNQNLVKIDKKDGIQITGDIFSGYAGINLSYGDFTAGEATIANVNVNVNASIITDNNKLSSNNNKIKVAGNHNTFNDIFAGNTGINLTYGDFTTADITADATSNDIYNISKTTSKTDATTTANVRNNKLRANNNKIKVAGNDNTFKNIFSGYAEINLTYEDFTTGNAYITGNTYSIASANANTNASIDGNQLSTNNNKIKVSGNNNTFNDIFAGYAGINLTFGDITTGNINASANASSSVEANANAKKNTLSANKNTISITGDANRLKEIFSGYAGINLTYEDFTTGNANATGLATAAAYTSISATTNASENTLNANNNIKVAGNNNTFNDIFSGYAGINLTYGDFSSGTANALASYTTTDIDTNASNTTLSADNNEINVAGNINTFNDIFSSYAGINLTFGDITTATATAGSYGNASTIASIYTLGNKLSANNNGIRVTGNNNTFHNIFAGYTRINLTSGDFTTGTTTNASSAKAEASGNQLTANKNTISIMGDSNKFNDISAGYAGINLSYGDVIGGTISFNGTKNNADSILTIDTHDTKLNANQNKISLAGSSIISGDIKTGTIDFIIQHGKVEKADGTAGTININQYLAGTAASAKDNTISIKGEHQFTNPNSVIYGGSLNISEQGYKPKTYDVFTGNTLNYNNSVPIRIKEIGNFQTYNFTLNPALASTNTALITAESVILGSNESNLSDYLTKSVASDINVVGIQSGQLVPTGSQFILMQADAGKLIGSGQGYISNGVAQQGISLLYDVETKVDRANNQVIAVINSGHGSSIGPTVNPQLKSLLEGSLSGATLLNTSSDQLSNQLYSSIRSQSNQSNPNGQALFSPFAMMSGNRSRNNSGSYIKSNGTALTVGLGIQLEQFTGGIFIENGWDSYKTFNGFNNADDVNGKGHNRFNGLGLYGHYDFNNQFYSDVMVRAGRLKTHFETDDLINISTGERTAYDLKNNYYGASLKGGYLWSINTRNELDLSAQYAWTGTESRDLIVSGDPLHFDKMTSQRVILNAENNYKLTPQLTLLTGLGYEYEFDGKSKGTTYNAFNIDNPSMQGSTTLASLGLRYEPSHHRNLSLDFHGNGYYGKREGGSVGLKLNYIF